MGASRHRAVRTMVVWCPDWPVVAALRSGLVGPDVPVGVFRANRVVAASASARAEGVRRAMRRREAQSRCPALEVLDDDPGRDARCFEEVAAAIDVFTPRIEVVRPGLCQFPTRGPSRYFGGDVALADAVRLALARLGVEARLGMADGAFAAALAARQAPGAEAGPAAEPAPRCASAPSMRDSALVEGGIAHPGRERAGAQVGDGYVAPGGSAAFLAAFPITALVAVEAGRALTRAAASARRSRASASTPADALALVDLVDLLQRLGIHTLGAFAALPEIDVVSRFGPVGERAWRLASGHDVRPPQTRVPPPDLVVRTDLDPPVERVDTAAFIAKAMAEELHERLAERGLACTRVSIEAETEDGTQLARLWRHERAGAAGGLTAQNLADRVRWQLDGWLQRRAAVDANALRADGLRADEVVERLTGGITMLRLVPDEVVPDEGRQLGLWGGSSAADERAARAFARIQGLLGPDAVCTPVLTGGRRPSDLVTLVPWGDERVVPPTASQPWPGRLPAPLPTVVHPLPLTCEVLGAGGEPVRVSGRGEATAMPATLRIGDTRARAVTTWAGPWPLEERWWDLQAARRQARMQIVTDDQRAYLVVLEGGTWWVEAEYA